MSVLQSTYTDTVPAAYAGMVANGETSNRISRTSENSGGIGFGKVAYRGSGDHGIVATQTLVGAGSEAASNAANTGTITDVPTVALGAKLGRYVVTIVEPGTNLGNFTVEDPDGVIIGEGVVATEFVGGGLTFTVADGATDFSAGDQLYVDVTGNEALGITIATQGVGLLAGETADKYRQYDDVPIMTQGVIWVLAGGTVTDGAAVQVDASGDFVASGGMPLSGWKFDTSGADDAFVKIAKR